MCALPSIAWTNSARRYQPGDLVVVVKSPLQRPYPALAGYYEQCRTAVGKTARVLYVDKNGRPELDFRDSESLLGWSISIEPECLSLVESSALSKAEKNKLIEVL